MTAIANNAQCLHECPHYASSTSSRTQISHTEVSATKTLENGSRLQVSLSSSSSQYSETRYTPGKREPAMVYQAPPRQTETVEGQQEPTEKSTGAGVILSFIELRLQTDQNEGASKEDLQSRLQAGYEGFMQGYNEAVSMLEAMGLFEGDVKTAVEQMYKEVILGFADLAEKFELDNPAPAGDLPEETLEPSATNPVTAAPSAPSEPALVFKELLQKTDTTQSQEIKNLQSLIAPTQDFYTRMQAETAATREYNFSLRTADGDTVNIRAFAGQYARYQSESDANKYSQQFDVANMESFEFSVQGELDEDELRAISDLLAQLNDVAELFFNGDVYSAFEQALEIGYDSDEIARFSLNLNQGEYTRIEKAYGTVAKLAPQRFDRDNAREDLHARSPLENKVAHLSEFLRLLEKIREDAERFHIEPKQLGEFAAFAKHKQHSEHPHVDKLEPFVTRMSETLKNQKA